MSKEAKEALEKRLDEDPEIAALKRVLVIRPAPVPPQVGDIVATPDGLYEIVELFYAKFNDACAVLQPVERRKSFTTMLEDLAPHTEDTEPNCRWRLGTG